MAVQTSQAQERQSFSLPFYSEAIPSAHCWGQLPSRSVSAMSPAPSTLRSWLSLPSKVPGSVSISGRDWVCVKARWGETSSPDIKSQSPDINFKISMCAEPGKEPNPRSFRFSSFPRDRSGQGASSLVAQTGQAQTGQEGLSRGIEDGQTRAEQTASSGVQVQVHRSTQPLGQ